MAWNILKDPLPGLGGGGGGGNDELPWAGVGGNDELPWAGANNQQEPQTPNTWANNANPNLGFEPELMKNNYIGNDTTGWLRDQAMRDPQKSPWMKYQMEQERLRQAGDRDKLANVGASNLASQQGQMAMRGGLTSGATERLGRQNLMSQLQGQQDLSRGAAAREAGIRTQGDERQRALMAQLHGAQMEEARFKSGIDQSNIDQTNKNEALKYIMNNQGGANNMENAAANTSNAILNALNGLNGL